MTHRLATQRITPVALLIIAASASALLAGPVVIDSQLRDISVNVGLDGSLDGIQKDIAAPDNNPFNASLDEALPEDPATRAQASQTSQFQNISDTEFTASGEGEVLIGIGPTLGTREVNAVSRYNVSFTIDEPRTYNLSASGSFIDNSFGGTLFAVELADSDFNTIVAFDKKTFSPGFGDNALFNVPLNSQSGVLEPGSYSLSAVAWTLSGREHSVTEFTGSYSFEFSLTSTETPPPTPIPLPAGVWAGMALFTAAGLAKRRFRLGMAKLA